MRLIVPSGGKSTSPLVVPVTATLPLAVTAIPVATWSLLLVSVNMNTPVARPVAGFSLATYISALPVELMVPVPKSFGV